MRVLIPSLTSPFGSLFFTSEVLTRMQCPAWCWRRLVLKSLACHRASLGSIPVRWSLIGWQSEGFSVLTTPGFPPYRAHNAFTLQSKLLWFARLAEGQEICCLAGLFSSWQLHAHFHHKLSAHTLWGTPVVYSVLNARSGFQHTWALVIFAAIAFAGRWVSFERTRQEAVGLGNCALLVYDADFTLLVVAVTLFLLKKQGMGVAKH